LAGIQALGQTTQPHTPAAQEQRNVSFEKQASHDELELVVGLWICRWDGAAFGLAVSPRQVAMPLRFCKKFLLYTWH
jgi:hypothetical protein